jgi:hypothetical protein
MRGLRCDDDGGRRIEGRGRGSRRDGLSVLVATWMRRQAVDPAYTQALINNGWLVSFVVSMRYTTLKGWSGRTQAIFTGVLLTLVALLALAGAWINSR